jgi:multidrug efflux pump subunit AcrA (membrane-fusion protein)
VFVHRIGALVALLFFAGCSSGTAAKPDQEPTPAEDSVRVVRAVDGVLHPALSLAGTIAPLQVVDLSNSLSEPTQAVYVDEGDRVRAGQSLADLNVDDLRAQLRSAQQTAGADRARTTEAAYNAQLAFASSPNNVKAAQAQLVQTQKTLHEAIVNRDRIATLTRQGYIASQNLDEQNVVVTNDRQAVVQAQAQLQTAIATQRVNGTRQSGLQASTIDEQRYDASAQLASADQIAKQISRAHITSPVNGIVINRNLNPGEYPAGRQIFTIEASDTVYAILTASAIQAYQIHKNDPVEVHSPGLPRNRRFTGNVAALLDAATAGSTNFVVKVAIPNRDGILRAGTPVQAIVALLPVRGIVVPSSAFEDDQRTRVTVVVDGRVRLRRVTEIATDGANSIVEGIAPGDRVVRDGTQSLTDGQRVAMVR